MSHLEVLSRYVMLVLREEEGGCETEQVAKRKKERSVTIEQKVKSE